MFDCIIGNPPYQLKDKGNAASARALYGFFVEKCKKLHPRALALIIPAKWYTGGKGLDTFRKTMLNDKNIHTIIDVDDARSIFGDIILAGGICIVVWGRKIQESCSFTTTIHTRTMTVNRRLDKYPILIRDPVGERIVDKVLEQGEPSLSSLVYPRDPFHISTFERGTFKGQYVLHHVKGISSFDYVERNADLANHWKVMLTRLVPGDGGRLDKNGQSKVLSTLRVLPPKHVCTDTYLAIGKFDTQEEAEALASYLRTKFVRFLIHQATMTQQLSKQSFRFVPVSSPTGGGHYRCNALR